jgi:hypothetical protein
MISKSIWTRLLTRLIGSQWRVFCGLSQESFVTTVVETLAASEYSFAVKETEPTDTERTMLGADVSGQRITVKEPASFEIEVISATVDPLTGFMMGFLLPEEKQKEATKDLCVVTISPIDQENRPEIAPLLTEIIGCCERPPWKVSHHTSFQLAVLLRVKIRLLWTYWLTIKNQMESR